MNNKRLAVSLIGTVIAFLVSMSINFFLTPYIVSNVGSEAYGFVSLANNFTGYAQILTVALNSMAGRYITIAYHQKKYEDASKYFKAVVVGNIFMCLIMMIPSVLVAIFINKIVNISSELVIDIRILFLLMFFAFFVTLVSAAFSISTFTSNRKDIEAKRTIESYIIKGLLLLVLYYCFKPYVLYVGIVNLVISIYLLVFNIYYTKKLLPEISIKNRGFDKTKIVVLLKSGMWNAVSRVSTVLSDGLDLLITNLFISSEAMGILAIAKMVPSVISSLVGTVGGVFAPNYTISYAQGNKKELLNKIRQSMIILGTVSNMCIGTLVVIGSDFFTLWTPGEDANLLQILSILSVAGLSVNGGLQCIFNIFTITNKIKANSVVSILTNFMTIIIVFILLNATDLGIYAIAGVSTVIAILRNLCFSIPYGAYCIDIKFREFYKPVFVNLVVLIGCSLVGLYFKGFISIVNWVQLGITSFIIAIMIFIVNILFLTNNLEKKKIYMIAKKIARIKNVV